MGGLGSGRRGGSGRTAVEACLRLDVRALRRAGYLREHLQAGVWRWRHDGGTSTVSITASATKVALAYRVAGEPRQAGIAIEWTRAPLGGRVPWFRCPGVGCGRRCAAILSFEGAFACRRCHRLAYASQHETAFDRLKRKAAKAWQRIGAEFPTDVDVDKPKGMHVRTWERLHARAEVLGTMWEHEFAARLAVINDRSARAARMRGWRR